MERALTLVRLGLEEEGATWDTRHTCGQNGLWKSIACAIRIGRQFSFNILRELGRFRWEMCVKAESFDVEEEVGRRWSTDGRWDGVSPPAALYRTDPCPNCC